MTPSPAVAENLAQLVARLSHSRFSRRKASTVVPLCITALAKMMALWHTDSRACTPRPARASGPPGRVDSDPKPYARAGRRLCCLGQHSWGGGAGALAAPGLSAVNGALRFAGHLRPNLNRRRPGRQPVTGRDGQAESAQNRAQRLACLATRGGDRAG